MELTTAIDWFGTMAGLFGVCIAVYLQLINPRHCRPGPVAGLFVGGSALIMVFSSAWNPYPVAVASMKLGAIVLFVVLEGLSGYYIWTHAQIAPPREVVSTLFDSDDGGGRCG